MLKFSELKNSSAEVKILILINYWILLFIESDRGVRYVICRAFEYNKIPLDS
jgi:hypothetical protein